MTELKVDLEPIRRAESSLDAATESLNQTRQDQGSLRSCVGDAPGLGDALGQLSSDWAIHRERLLKEVSELKTNLTQYRTKLEAMDEEGGKAMGGAGGSTSDTASPPVASGAAATPAAPGAASGSAATAAPIPAPSAGGVPVAPAPVPAGAVPGGPDQGSSTVPPPSAHAVTPPTPPGIEPTLQQAIDEDNRTVSGLVDRWSAEAQALAQRGLPLTALGPAAIALLALYGRLPSADAVGAAGPSAGMRAGDSADRDIDPAQARRLIEAADSGKPTTSPPADGSAGTPGGIPQEERTSPPRHRWPPPARPAMRRPIRTRRPCQPGGRPSPRLPQLLLRPPVPRARSPEARQPQHREGRHREGQHREGRRGPLGSTSRRLPRRPPCWRTSPRPIRRPRGARCGPTPARSSAGSLLSPQSPRRSRRRTTPAPPSGQRRHAQPWPPARCCNRPSDRSPPSVRWDMAHRESPRVSRLSRRRPPAVEGRAVPLRVDRGAPP